MNKFWSKTKEIARKNRKRIIFISIMIITLVVFAFLKTNSYICEYIFARGISRFLLSGISAVTNLVPFSLTEWTYVIGIAFLVFFLIKIIIHFVKKNYKKAFDIIYRIGAVAITLVVLLNVLFTFQYNRYPLGEELGLKQVDVNAELAYDAAEYYINEANALAQKFERDSEGGVISPYTFEETVQKINEEYKRLTSDYFNQFYVRNKPMLFSKLMCYAGFSGIYFPFYAESNISVTVPSYTLPVTICHELAHTKGVMRENEANFTAYYLLITSQDDYLRYCALLYASNICLNETYDEKDESYYRKAYSLVSDEIWTEYSSASKIWQSYDTFLDDIGNWFNNLYLKSSGVASGVKSYSQTGVFLIRLHQTILDGMAK